jgi:two-component system, response regulator YesN
VPVAYNVLIIDDEPWSRKVVRSLGRWDELGLTVIGEAEDGTEGLRMMEALRPDIVVTDMRMPGLEGVELLQAMKDRYPATRIVVMSGYDDFAYLQQAIRSRALNYLLKPIDPEELNSSLQDCIRELDRDSGGAIPGASFSLAALDPAMLERYGMFRKQIYGYVMDRNAAAIPGAFRQFCEYAEQSLQDSDSLDGLAARIEYDFRSMLEEHLVSMGCRFDDLKLPAMHRICGMPAVDAIQATGRMLHAVLSKAAEQRAVRAKLDIAEVEAFIELHSLDAISLETIARHYAVSKEHLSRAFKNGTGRNVSDAIVQKRMDSARHMIEVEGISIKRAAELTGYADIAYFYRVFKKHFGITPGELRR